MTVYITTVRGGPPAERITLPPATLTAKPSPVGKESSEQKQGSHIYHASAPSEYRPWLSQRWSVRLQDPQSGVLCWQSNEPPPFSHLYRVPLPYEVPPAAGEEVRCPGADRCEHTTGRSYRTTVGSRGANGMPGAPTGTIFRVSTEPGSSSSSPRWCIPEARAPHRSAPSRSRRPTRASVYSRSWRTEARKAVIV